MNVVEAIGNLASALVLTTFYMRDIVALRCTAIDSNLAFVAYSLADLDPVPGVAPLLLPVNVLTLAGWRAPTSDRT